MFWFDGTTTATTDNRAKIYIYEPTATIASWPALNDDACRWSELIRTERARLRKESQIIASKLEPVMRLWSWIARRQAPNLKQPSRVEARRHARKRYVQKLALA